MNEPHSHEIRKIWIHLLTRWEVFIIFSNLGRCMFTENFIMSSPSALGGITQVFVVEFLIWHGLSCESVHCMWNKYIQSGVQYLGVKFYYVIQIHRSKLLGKNVTNPEKIQPLNKAQFHLHFLGLVLEYDFDQQHSRIPLDRAVHKFCCQLSIITIS